MLLAFAAAPNALAAKTFGKQAKHRVAKKGDRNRDRIPDRWERRHGLSLKVNQARRDQDRDGLRNRAEYLARTDPRDKDSDDDGIKDGKERAGTVQSFDGTTLVIRLFNGEDVSATVDDRTEVECHTASQLDAPATAATRARRASSGDDGPGDDHGAGDEPGDDHGAGDEPGDDHGDHDEPGDDHGDDEGKACGPDALEEGVTVHEAELAATADGKVWREVELIVKAA